MTDLLWSEAEREAWRPPENLAPSEWANRYRILDAASIESGPYLWERTPYMREPLDSIADRSCWQLTFEKSTQVGGTELLRNHVGWIVDQDPGPVLFVVPRKEDLKSYSEETLRPIFESSPRLRRHKTGRPRDWATKRLRFKRCTVFLGSAQSAVDLARRPIRYLFGDETDKWPQQAGKEGAPFDLARERQRTFEAAGIAKAILNSTPTTRDGLINIEYLKSDQRKFHIPCPHCGAFQVLRWGQIRFPKEERDPDVILKGSLATYECEACELSILDHHKPAMLERGVWCPSGYTVENDGTVVDDDGAPAPSIDLHGHTLWVPARHRGYHVWAAYSPWITFSRIVFEFLIAHQSGDPIKLMSFTNSWLAELWEEKLEEPKYEEIAQLTAEHDRATVPRKALVLTAGVDVQKGVLYYVIRAWGKGERSWLVEAGRVERWPELASVLFSTRYPFFSDGDDREWLPVRLACVDSGYATDDVVNFCRDWPDVARPTKGWDARPLPITAARMDRDWAGRAAGIQLWHLDTGYFKDKLTRLIHTERDLPGSWLIHSDPSEEYLRQASSEHKVIIRSQKTRTAKSRWVTRPGSGGRNHWWDCEVYALAAAEMLGVWTLRDEEASVPASMFAKSQQGERRPSEGRGRGGRFVRKGGGIRRRRDR